MRIENAISWCDETGNKVTGCDKVSPGCKNCYAQVGTRARVLRASGIETWGPKGQRYPVADFSKKVRRLNKLCVCDTCHTAADVQYLDPKYSCHHCLNSAGKFSKFRRIRIFADSNSDWLDNKWRIETLADLLKDIHDTPNLDHLLLTKRAENFGSRMNAIIAARLDNCGVSDWFTGQSPPANVWLGVSVEDQKRADERRDIFKSIPARYHFVSYEPALEVVDWTGWEFLDWMIPGLESGKDRRDGGIGCITSAVSFCQTHKIPVYVKQDCAFKSGQQGRIPEGVWTLKQFPA